MAMNSAKLALLPAILSLSVLMLAQAPETPSTQPKISTEAAEGLKIHNVDPIYPKLARDQRIQGDVLLAATIDMNGKIENLKVLQGDPLLADAAMRAVKQWRYRPYMLKGEPVAVATRITVRFRLPNSLLRQP